MLEFKLNEENYFEFEMQITGDADTNAQPLVEFAINLNNGMKLSFIAERKDSVYAVTVPALKEHFIKPGEHDCNLSVFLGDKYFAPYSGKCNFKEEVKPVISNIKVEHKDVKTSAPVITFVQKDKAPAITEAAELSVVDESLVLRNEQIKKESGNLDKLLSKKRK
jgi:hypothetical protein